MEDILCANRVGTALDASLILSTDYFTILEPSGFVALVPAQGVSNY